MTTVTGPCTIAAYGPSFGGPPVLRHILLLLLVGLAGCLSGLQSVGDERVVAGLKLCWCPPGKFTMGSPTGEPGGAPTRARSR